MKMFESIKIGQVLCFAASALILVNAAPLVSNEGKNDTHLEDASIHKQPTDSAAKLEVNPDISESTTPKISSTVKPPKSPEIAEPPEPQPSDSVQKRASAPLLGTQMPSELLYEEQNPEGVDFEEELNKEDISDGDLYLRSLLSDPQLVRDIMEEETRLREFQQVPPEMDVDLKPSSVAWYLLATGDIEGVTRMINALVAYGALSLEEARDYRMAVEEEYSGLTQMGEAALSSPERPLVVPQDYEGDTDYSNAFPYPVGIPAYPLPVGYEAAIGNTEEQDYQPWGGAYPAETQGLEEEFYDNVMKELMEAIAKENDEKEELKIESLAPKSITGNSEKSENSGVKSSLLLEDELKGLYQNSADKQNKKEDEKEMSVEQQLEQLLGDNNTSRDNKNKQANRTKSLKSLENKSEEKKDNEKKA